ncbi:hypothetical protein [Pseudomonas retamae]|uniref:Toxin CdiA n=1 Tax=Pseudomonas retamae TaxID=702110 RepID=A0ABW7DDS5_9PSED
MPGADQAKANLLAMSQLIAVLSAVVADTDPNIAANIAATATQYNYLSHSDLERAAHELSACGNDAACANTKYAEYHDLSQKQDIQAVAQCAANPANCDNLSRLVAEAEAKAQQLKDLAASASPEAVQLFNLLIAENFGFQNMLAGITAGHSVAAIADTLVKTFRMSREVAMATAEGLVTAASTMGPLIKTTAGGKGIVKEGAGEIAGTAKKFSIADRVFGQLNDPRMGQLAGKLDADTLQILANNPSATRFMDARTGHINVIQEVEGKLIRITVPRDEMKLFPLAQLDLTKLKIY